MTGLSSSLTRRGALSAALTLAVAVGTWGLTGCAVAPSAPPGGWSGRIALTLASEPAQRWSAAFDLEGSPTQGTLRLYTPLGQTLATVGWTADGAWLDRGDGAPTRYPDVATLTAELTGAALPVAALFDWLAGVARDVPGWRVDLSDHAAGRLRAQRLAPPPAADLRLTWRP
ncbi:outer membrane lipoprotein LolB [Tepidimonas taiwanensis]|uniref:Outer-membrane lipoprotein LolB n=1 Tax=Tepidimonas taiwanensis TaxID=307486 RepID=A0A554X0T8_9BURK|nr:lipoprotein insertase outer membrane protein LolB [Tepidimonas taiwanensis]MDM7463336.1 lipoprotein insertase outer membrane protein LolB [Tepidimonas taiwanensis]TSE29467.1 Outer-membrane lipoprotein LolB [Tepidimonas taiwanensis]UBQ05867.1 outer membrane lipoprotein LolB [Tepidimonas taiwanensis]